MKSYEGNENYIFVSYAHKDAAAVVPILERLSADGFRVWYDAGIEAGTEWPEYIADHLMRSAVVLVFMSNASAASPNCRKEINFSLELGKELLVVYLEDTQMSAGMRLQLNSHQAMFRTRHKNDATFISELERSKLLLRAKEGYIQKEDDKTKTGPTAFVSQPVPRASSNAPYIISTVCTYASNNAKSPWQGGTHLREISANRYSVVHFQCRLSNPFGCKGKAMARITVYNYADAPVFDTTEDITMSAKSDHFAFSWVIRDKSGTFQSPGDYVARIQFEDSEIYECPFTILYQHVKTASELRAEAREDKKQRKRENRARHHLGLLYSIPLSIAFSFTVTGSRIGLGLVLILFALFLRFTKKYVTKSFLLSFLLCSILYPFYSIYMFVMLIKRFIDR